MRSYIDDPALFTLFDSIAKRRLDIRTLRTRGRDSLDFHDVSVWALLDIMQETYNAGLEGNAQRAKVIHDRH